ncbi:hypothetical protein FA95DRAFT_1608507 [Auriscalpium vulgare]|uniref:Uncharacterized protein n=1 Tax=Auriscalpium vulgare TaxID=40419 RepID=A0ACB8RL80_9AGAM|nr:hypothetical protein FA95DRAFT_1608507 [Auriscalpium vulgare]
MSITKPWRRYPFGAQSCPCSPPAGLPLSTDAFIKEFNTATVVTTANPDPLLTHVPIIDVDIWEHAVYIPPYLAAIWNAINFQEAEKRYLEGTGGSKL